MFYNKKQLEAVKFVSKDETRQGLSGLLFEENRVVATDGHRLMIVNKTPSPDTQECFPPDDIFSPDKNEPFVVSRKTVEKITKNIPVKMRPNDCLEVIKIGHSVKDHKIACQAYDLEETTTLETADGLKNAKFPNYKQVLPDYTDYIKIGISAKYLKEVCMALEKYNNNAMVTLNIIPPKISENAEDNHEGKYQANYPIVITADDGEGTTAEAVIMPMRL